MPLRCARCYTQVARDGDACRVCLTVCRAPPMVRSPRTVNLAALAAAASALSEPAGKV